MKLAGQAEGCGSSHNVQLGTGTSCPRLLWMRSVGEWCRGVPDVVTERPESSMQKCPCLWKPPSHNLEEAGGD